MRLLIKSTPKDIDVTTINLIETRDPNWKMFNCPVCRNPLFRYRGHVLSILPGEVPSEIPVLLKCTNSNCGHNYLVEKILSREVFV